MNKFAQMTTQQFCDYVSSNPGGARKAYHLRTQDNPECHNPEVVYQYKIVYKEGKELVYRDRVVYKERDRINVQYVEREVTVVKEVVKEVYLNPIDWLFRELNGITNLITNL